MLPNPCLPKMADSGLCLQLGCTLGKEGQHAAEELAPSGSC